MKKGMLFFVFVLFSLPSFGQLIGVCDYSYSMAIDSTDFSNSQSARIYYEIDTSLVNNIWQVGAIAKSGFPIGVFGSRAMQTDTLNSYDTNNVSAFYVWTDSVFFTVGMDSIVSLSFWHYYDVDSLGDSCTVQMTLDSGLTWLNYADYQLFPQMEYDYQVPLHLEPFNSGKFLWTGASAGWQNVKICFTYFGISPQRSMDWPVGFRFLFKSDSIQTNKPGWIIDKINFRTPGFVGAVKDLKNQALPIYPNPSHNGHFTIDFPSTYVQGKFFVYDFLGRNVKTIELKEQIDLSDLPNGIYTYKSVFEKTNQWFSGKIEIR